MSMKILVYSLFLFTIPSSECSNVVSRSQLYPLSIIHVNDFHARFEETNQGASPCNPGEKCIGGYARLVSMVKKLFELRSQTNPIYLNAGDNFQGTLWYNIGRWNVTSYFLNLLKADAMTLGNHEFDHGVEGVVPFLEHIQSPMVVANIDDTDEPTMQGKYEKSVVLEKGGRKIGVIGVILQTTDQIANTGKLKFTNESQAVSAEAERLHNNGVDIIIVLSHCGLDVDRVIAAKAGPYVDVIVGGHSHTFLYTGPNPPGIDKPQDKYPVEIIQEDGHKVLIVQASAYLKYLGDITVYFNENGEVSYYEGAPIYLDSDVEEEHIQSPMVVANIDDTDEPTMQGKYEKSVVLEKGGRKIGVIGVILQTTDQIANTGKLKFTNESQAVSAEAERLHNNGVDIIIVLSHCGLDVDRVIAAKAGPYVDVIVGGHSHTFLYTGPNPPGIDKPQDKYPVEIIQEDGHKVLIVQASAYLKYLGDITVYFNENGEVSYYEGAPIYLDSDVEEDHEIVKELKPWKELIDKEGTKKVGTSRVKLSTSRCRLDECNIGNFFTDAMLDEFAKDFTNDDSWTTAAIAMTNVGGIRTTLNKGELTYAHIVSASPFENSIDSFNLHGKHLLEALEYSVASSWSDDISLANMLQVSGLKVTYNVSKPIGQRVTEVKVRCQKCDVPKYLPLKETEVYKIITPSFLASGGDGFFMIRDNKLDHKIGRVDVDVLVDYVKKQSPIMAGGDERITVFQ